MSQSPAPHLTSVDELQRLSWGPRRGFRDQRGEQQLRCSDPPSGGGTCTAQPPGFPADPTSFSSRASRPWVPTRGSWQPRRSRYCARVREAQRSAPAPGARGPRAGAPSGPQGDQGSLGDAFPGAPRWVPSQAGSCRMKCRLEGATLAGSTVRMDPSAHHPTILETGQKQLQGSGLHLGSFYG